MFQIQVRSIYIDLDLPCKCLLPRGRCEKYSHLENIYLSKHLFGATTWTLHFALLLNSPIKEKHSVISFIKRKNFSLLRPP